MPITEWLRLLTYLVSIWGIYLLICRTASSYCEQCFYHFVVVIVFASPLGQFSCLAALYETLIVY